MPLDERTASALHQALDSQGVPDGLIQALLTSARDLIDHYLAGRLRPSELSGGDFAEAVFRVLQFLSNGNYTPVGRTLPRLDVLQHKLEAASHLDDSLRLHIPRVLRTVYDVRNRRGVGHLPGPISANRSDAGLLLTCCKWVLTELLRLFFAQDLSIAQELMDSLMIREVPLVQDFGGTLRVISRRDYSLPEQVVLLLYAAEPDWPTRDQLLAWTRARSASLSTVLSRLDQRGEIHRYPDNRTQLTILGQRRAEGLLRESERQPA